MSIFQFEIGKKYLGTNTLSVYTCVYVGGIRSAGGKLSVLRDEKGEEHVTYTNVWYQPYVAPIKPFRIRTVVAQNTVTGGVRIASIMDNYLFHRVDDPTWPTGWGTGNEVRVYDEITEVPSA